MPNHVTVPFSPPDISQAERAGIDAVLQSGWITTGPVVKEFEKELATYCGTDRCAALNSATAAMELTLRVLGIGPGDEVITSAYTYTASASVIDHVGARIVLVDTAPSSYHLDLDAVDAAITERTKAVIPVDIGGVMTDYRALAAICESHSGHFRPKTPSQEAIGRVAIVADAAHSLGSQRDGTKSGQAADFTCFSFHAVKNLTTAEGGAVTWRSDLPIPSDVLYRQFMLLSLHGQTKDALAKSSGSSWEYDVVMPGYKANMTDVLASIGRAQLARYEDMLAKRHGVIDQYDAAMKRLGVEPMSHSGDDFLSNGHLYLVDLRDRGRPFRDQLIEDLLVDGINANVHYKPLPMLTAYRNLGFDIVDYPRAFHRFENEITLPLFSTMTDEQVDTVIESLYCRLR